MITVLAAVFSGLAGSVIVAFVTSYYNKSQFQFYYGKLTQKVNDHGEDIDALKVDVKDHETRISRLEGPARA